MLVRYDTFRLLKILVKTLHFCPFFAPILASTAGIKMPIKSELTRVNETNEHFLKPGKIALQHM